jgi:hypothetical protein
MTAEWVAAIGTAGALLIGIVVLFFRLGDRRQRRTDRTRAQATQVSAWCVEAGTDEYGGHTVTIAVQNRSEGPISEVAAHIMSGDLADFVESVAVVVPPATREKYVIASPMLVRHDPTHWPTVVDLAFTDSKGQKWVRRSDGALESDGLLRGSPPNW